jgi:hypothetical protein
MSRPEREVTNISSIQQRVANKIWVNYSKRRELQEKSCLKTSLSKSYWKKLIEEIVRTQIENFQFNKKTYN